LVVHPVNPFLAAALEYREAGLHPLALLPRSKRPLVPWREFQERMPTIEEIQGWWAMCPDANVGIILGRGALAVDVDGPEAEAALKAAGINLGNGPQSKTSRGRHMYYQGAAPDKIGLLDHVDVRGVGYVVAPPSVHESGHVYRWESPIGTAPLPAAPAALVALLAEQKPRAAATQEKWLSLALEGVGEGTRDVTCYKLAAYFTSKGIPQDVIEQMLFLWADRCEPPFPHEQVVIKVQSASKHTPEAEGPPVGIAEVVDLTVAEILDPARKRGAAATEFTSLDDLLAGGLYPGEYTLLGARPSAGKTAFALQIMRQLARKGIGGLFVSLEMGNKALVRRLLSQAGRIDSKAIKMGTLDPMQKEMLAVAAAGLRKLPLWLTNDIQTTAQLATALEAYPAGSLGLVVIDYIQLLSGEGYDARQRIGVISKDLRRIANRFEVPVLGLSQLRRPDPRRPQQLPVREDLKESGDLEADADIVILMSREQGKHETTFDVAKNRDGEVSGERKIVLAFQPNILTFEEA
jgi:KaiC/GvpD/RAD55 family RecA-like ATPase